MSLLKMRRGSGSESALVSQGLNYSSLKEPSPSGQRRGSCSSSQPGTSSKSPPGSRRPSNPGLLYDCVNEETYADNSFTKRVPPPAANDGVLGYEPPTAERLKDASESPKSVDTRLRGQQTSPLRHREDDATSTSESPKSVDTRLRGQQTSPLPHREDDATSTSSIADGDEDSTVIEHLESIKDILAQYATPPSSPLACRAGAQDAR